MITWALKQPPPGGQPDTGTWQTGDCDTIQKGLKSNALAEGGIRRLFVAHNGFKISLGKLDKGLIQVGAWNLQLAFRKKELLERSLNFWEGWWGVWVWSIHFSLLDAGEGGLLLQLMWGLLAQYRGERILIQGMTPSVPGQGAESHERQIQVHERNTNTKENHKHVCQF